MRFKSPLAGGYCIYAVTGTNTVSFGIDYSDADITGLLGFSVKRSYPDGSEHYMPGFKLFETHKGKFGKGDLVGTDTDPIQSFVWDDFTLKPDQVYKYTFYPVKGAPEALIKQAPIIIKVRTEPAFSKKEHDIFFNRGVASSQAYAREFDNKSPDKLVGKKQTDAFNWLARDLEKALLEFIGQAKKGDYLFGCFYEFNYAPVLQAFRQAIGRGVHLKLVLDGKNNEHEEKGKKVESYPRMNTLQALHDAGIGPANYILREANKSVLQHNKFMVFRKKGHSAPSEVWTGSVNITESGIFGQTNVGHWVRNADVAKKYMDYWNLLSEDPGAKDDSSAAGKKTEKKEYIDGVMKIQKDVASSIPKGVTPIFSPRSSEDMLDKYFSLVADSEDVGAITLAFGVTKKLKDRLLKHTSKESVIFMMLEKQDEANPRSKEDFVALSAKNNVYEAFGSYIKDPLYNWVAEKNMRIFKIASHVVYIHSKFLLRDPLGDDPIIVTGSANFSPPSTVGNDENMIVIRGDHRVADIYFTEFNRIFNHYYYRSIVAELNDKGVKDDQKYGYLDPTDGWTKAYKKGSLRDKRLAIYTGMKNAEVI